MKDNKENVQSIVEKSFVYYIKNFKMLIFTSLFIFVPFIIIMFIFLKFNSILPDDVIRLFGDSKNIIYTLFLRYLPIMLFNIIFYPLLIGAISLKLENNNLKNVYRILSKRLLVCLPVFIVASFLKVSGYVLIIIPGLIIQTYFSFLPFTSITEKQGFLKSFKQSVSIVRGNFKKVLSFILVLFVFEIILNSFFSLIMDNVFPICRSSLFDELVLFKQNIAFYLSGILVLNIFAGVYFSTAWVFMYNHLKSK